MKAAPQLQKPHPVLQPRFWRISMKMYHEMIDAGTLTTEDRVELLDGYLVHKIPQNDPHATAVESLSEIMHRMVPQGWRIRTQLPITLSTSEPEPDVAIIRGTRKTAPAGHPTAASTVLLIEVADSSLRLDREVKSEIYARDGVPVYWIVNLVDRQVEVHSDPQPDTQGYRKEVIYKPGDAVPIALDGQTVGTISVGDLVS